MYLKIKKHQGIFMQHNGIDKRYIVMVTSNFLLNLDQVAEVSFYTLKETKTRQDLEGRHLEFPTHSSVIHLQMSYAYALRNDERDNKFKGQIIERQYYKLFFRPENQDPYLELRQCIETHVGNL